MEFLKFSAFTGFIVSSTLLANLNFKTFKRILGDKSSKYWWLMGILMIIPLLIVLFTFSLLFS